MERITEIQARLAAISTELEAATGEALTALENESRSLLEELNGLKAEIEARQKLRSDIVAGAGAPVPGMTPKAEPSAEERRAQEFAKTRKMTVGTDEARALLISSGKLAQSTEVTGINDTIGAKYSSILDMIKINNCVGMGTYRVAYSTGDALAAGEHVEGGEVGAGNLGYFNFVDIVPINVAVIDYISKQAKKQTPLNYSAKVHEQATVALRRAVQAEITNMIDLSFAEGKGFIKGVPLPGEIDATTLRKLVFAYGGDESIVGGAVLFLNKKDLIAFGDVRGTNEKGAVYEIIPDGANPNTGVIKDGGLSVRYCICKGLAPYNETVVGGGSEVASMIYGNPQCIELCLFSDYEIKVSEDFAINKLMDTIVGDVEFGVGITVKDGFVTPEFAPEG
jgi:HK97 family phage major capsid protein